jgi:hypothetical protein
MRNNAEGDKNRNTRSVFLYQASSLLKIDVERSYSRDRLVHRNEM